VTDRRPTFDAVVIADEPDAWTAAGFAVDPDGTCRVGGIRLRLMGRTQGKGFRSWSIRNLAGGGDIDGLATSPSEAPFPDPAVHPCGATSIDHLVVLTPDGARTADAVTAVTGADVRRVRDTDARGAPVRQRFFRFGEAILEVVSTEPPGSGAARFFGIAVVVEDLEAWSARAGGRLGEIRDAVQPGRRVATLDTKACDLSVPVLFMSPEPG
jgi:hypothetical protein